MTALADVINEAMIYIDDIRLQEQLAINPALFYRRMSLYVTAAMPLLSSPPQLLDYIYSGYIEPEYASISWTSTEASMTEETVIQTEMAGCDICTVVEIDSEGNMSLCQGWEYDPETGAVTFQTQSSAGTEYEIDLYKDGTVEDLTITMKRLFALAMAIVWDERFQNNWLNLTVKIKDSSFQTVNESTYMDKLTNRMKENRQRFQDEMRKYEQNTAYKTIVSPYDSRSKLKLI